MSRNKRVAARKPRPPTAAQAAAAEVQLRQAMALQAQGSPAIAEQLCRQVLAVDADNPTAWHLLGLLAGERRALADAAEALGRAAALAPGDAVCQNNLGNVLRELGRDADAARAYRRALAVRADYAKARFNLGKALQNLGRADEAVACFRGLLELAPEDAEGWDALGAALLDAGEAEAAVDAHRKAVGLAPRSADAHNGLGLAYADLGRFEEACQSYRKALEIEPGFAKAALNLTRAKRFGDLADPDLARLREMAARDDVAAEDVADLRFSLGKALDDLGDFDSASEEFAAANAARAARESFDAEAHRRFVDDLRRVFTPALFERLAGQGVDDPTPVYIVGMPRSGTTLVEQIVASHPRAAGRGEMGTWQQLVSALPARLGGTPWPACVARLRRSDLRHLGRKALAALAGRDTDASRITDKMPANFLHLGLIASALPRASVLHCRRHPLDVVLSVWTHQFTYGHAWSWRLADIAAWYRQYRVLMDHWREVLPVRLFEVHYEELVAEPEAVSRAMLAHCELDWDERVLRFHETERQVHTASAWQVRQPINRAGVGRWHNYAWHLQPVREALAEFLPD